MWELANVEAEIVEFHAHWISNSCRTSCILPSKVKYKMVRPLSLLHPSPTPVLQLNARLASNLMLYEIGIGRGPAIVAAVKAVTSAAVFCPVRATKAMPFIPVGTCVWSWFPFMTVTGV